MLLSLVGGGSLAQEEPIDSPPKQAAPVGPVVVEVVVEGAVQFPEGFYRANLQTRVGEPLSERSLQEDLKKLWERWSVKATYSVLEEPDGVRVVFRVKESPKVRAVRFHGLKALEGEEVLAELRGTATKLFGEYNLYRLRRELLRKLREKGFAFAEVVLHTSRTSGGLEADVEVLQGPKVIVSRVVFEGLQAYRKEALMPFLAMHETPRFLGIPLFWKRAPFIRDAVDQDVEAVERFLQDRGWLDARAGLREVRFNGARTRATLVYDVREGERYTVSSVALEGAKAFPVEELLPLLQLEPGEPLTRRAILKDYETLEAYYGERSYKNFQRLRPKRVFDPDGPRVALTYVFREGEKIRIRSIRVEGNEHTRDVVIRRELSVFPGEDVNLTEIEKSLSRIDALGLFEPGVRGSEYFLPTGEPGVEDLVVRVRERRNTLITFGFGLSADSGILGGISIVHRNFDIRRPPRKWSRFFREFAERRAFTGGGQELTLDLFPGSEFSNYRLRFVEPYFLGVPPHPISFEVDVFKRYRFFDEYLERRTGAAIRLGRGVTREFAVGIGARLESVQISDLVSNAPGLLRAAQGASGLHGLEVSARYRDVDRFFFPTRGFRGQASYEVVGGPLGGDANFHQGNLRGTVYHTLFATERGQKILGSLSGTLGLSGELPGSDQVPIYERFFAGGLSFRGFDFRGIGPRVRGIPIGGEALALGTAELSFPLYATTNPETGAAMDEIFRGIVFLDTGSLARGVLDPEFRRFRLSVGFGVRLYIPPLGPFPFSLDFGWPLLQEEEDDPRVFSFSIGGRF